MKGLLLLIVCPLLILADSSANVGSLEREAGLSEEDASSLTARLANIDLLEQLDSKVFYGDTSVAVSSSTVVPTLSSPIWPEQNVIWCASIPALWKHIAKTFTFGPLEFEPMPTEATLLNASPDPHGDAPADGLYLAAGFVGDGLSEKIRREMSSLFPEAPIPDFSPYAPEDFVGFSYLLGDVRFTSPYEQLVTPIQFANKAGKITSVRGFGIPRDSYDQKDLEQVRKQLKVLYCTIDDRGIVDDCVLLLDRNPEKDRVIIAYVDEKLTLGEMVESVSRKIAQRQTGRLVRDLSEGESLAVPTFAFDI